MNTTKVSPRKKITMLSTLLVILRSPGGKGTCYTTEASIYYLQYILIRKKHSERKKRNDDKERDIH